MCREPAGAGLSRDEALRLLLSPSIAYEGHRSGVIPYAKEKVAWPHVGSLPVPVESCLGEAGKGWLRGWHSHMLCPALKRRLPLFRTSAWRLRSATAPL